MHEDLRPLLFSIAYRMLGTVSDAEDLVQEAFLRLHSAQADGQAIRSPRAFLTTVTTRLAVDELRSARKQRESYFGPWLPEPLLASSEPDAGAMAEMADSLSLTFLVLLERLGPVERAVFLLRDVFGYGYDEIAAIVDRSEAACRQILARARARLGEDRPRFEADRAHGAELAERFLDAMMDGDVDDLVELLAADVTFVGDGGGKGRGLPKPVFGSDRVRRLLLSFSSSYREIGAGVVPATINGQPGAMALDADGRLINVLAFELGDGVVHTVRSIINPDKLGHLGYELSDVGRA